MEILVPLVAGVIIGWIAGLLSSELIHASTTHTD